MMLTVDMVRDRLKRSVELVGSQKEWASRHGISAPYLHDVLYGRRNPGKPILDALGLSKIVAYLPNTIHRLDAALLRPAYRKNSMRRKPKRKKKRSERRLGGSGIPW